MEANDLQGVANLDPRGMVGMFNVGDHPTLLYTKYASCEPHGYRKEDFKKKKNPIMSMQAILSPGLDKFAPTRFV